MNDVHGVADLPDSHSPDSTAESANTVIPCYFATYEKEHQLPVLRPIHVTAIRQEHAGGELAVETSAGSLISRTLVNATGIWDSPFMPYYPGQETFTSQQFHTANYPGPQTLANKRRLVVGGGASAVQFLEGFLEGLAYRSDLLRVTRHEPCWNCGCFQRS